jgi:hypothetical protein
MSIEGALVVSTLTFGLLSDTARMFPDAGKKLLLQLTASNQLPRSKLRGMKTSFVDTFPKQASRN